MAARGKAETFALPRKSSPAVVDPIELEARNKAKARRGLPYTQKYACVTCRETRKRVVDWPHVPERLDCPTCDGAAVRMANKFRSPRKEDTAGWRQVEKLIADGAERDRRASAAQP